MNERSFTVLKSLGTVGSGADDVSFSSLPSFTQGFRHES